MTAKTQKGDKMSQNNLEVPVLRFPGFIIPLETKFIEVTTRAQSQLIKEAMLSDKLMLWINDSHEIGSTVKKENMYCLVSIVDFTTDNKFKLTIVGKYKFKVTRILKVDSENYPLKVKGKIVDSLQDVNLKLLEEFFNKINSVSSYLYELVLEEAKKNSRINIPANLLVNIADQFPMGELPSQIKEQFLQAKSFTEEVETAFYALNTVVFLKASGLAKSLYQRGHYEECVERIDSIKANGNFNPDFLNYFFILKIMALDKLGLYNEIIQFTEDSEVDDSNPIVSLIMAKSYLITRNDIDSVFKYLSNFLEDSPKVRHDFYDLIDEEVNNTDDLKEILEASQDFGISPYVVVEYIMPLVFDARDITCALFNELYLDTELLFEDTKESYSYLNIISSYAFSQYQVLCDVVYSFTFDEETMEFTPNHHLIFFKDKKYHQKIKKINSDYLSKLKDGKYREGQIFITESIGKLLNYPNCCVQNYIHHLKENKELELHKTLSKNIIIELSEDYDSPTVPVFTTGFLPCTVECAESYERMFRMFEAYTNKSDYYKILLRESFDFFQMRLQVWEDYNDKDLNDQITYLIQDFLQMEILSPKVIKELGLRKLDEEFDDEEE